MYGWVVLGLKFNYNERYYSHYDNIGQYMYQLKIISFSDQYYIHPTILILFGKEGHSWLKLILSPTAYQILWLLREGPQSPPPKISRKESSLTPCCYIAFVCLYI